MLMLVSDIRVSKEAADLVLEDTGAIIRMVNSKYSLEVVVPYDWAIDVKPGQVYEVNPDDIADEDSEYIVSTEPLRKKVA